MACCTPARRSHENQGILHGLPGDDSRIRFERWRSLFPEQLP